MFAGFEDIVGHRPNCEKIYRETADELHACDVTALQPGRDSNDFMNVEWRRAALNLTDHRTSELIRTLLALSVYFLAIFAEFIDQISGNGEASPGGRIGAAMCLSLLIPATLLSNMLRSFSSRRTCLETMMRLVAGQPSWRARTKDNLRHKRKFISAPRCRLLGTRGKTTLTRCRSRAPTLPFANSKCEISNGLSSRSAGQGCSSPCWPGSRWCWRSSQR
jgi:hypothetical protein